ncbi:MAG: dihydrodipicolinate synthase family protein [Clostridia bacterium]|nr:dihydrodipicolinate synthase family protein [Clostridia bacterium]
MITPYCSNGEVDYDTVKKYVYWYYENGCDGIFAVCQSSEIFFLSMEERVRINKVVYDTVREIERNGGRRMTVVSSGHVSDSIEDQAKELNMIAQSGTDALIFITNRLDINNEGDDVWISNAEKLMSMLPEDICLGVYECPYPYKRLLTPRILRWCVQTGRFRFIKDTCCDSELIKERIDILRGTDILLFNANCQTLLQSLRDGGAGYCGIMANYHPALYAWLCANYKKEPKKAELVQSFLCMSGFTEGGIPYPLTAKYHMSLEGIKTNLTTRNPACKPMTKYAVECVEQMRRLSRYIESEI